MTNDGLISFSVDALAFAQAYLDVGLVPSARISEVAGTRILWGDELLDTYGLLSPADRGVLAPFLDEAFYRAQRPDLPTGENALSDFFINGIACGINPHPLIDFEYMRFVRPDLMAERDADPKQFWRIFSDNLVAPSPFFDLSHFREHVEGNAASSSHLFDFLLRGSAVGCSPHPLIDIDRYRSSFDDAPKGMKEAFLHFIEIGDAERRSPGSAFDPEWYSRHYAEEGRLLDRPLAHYLRYGMFASRAPRESELETATTKTHVISTNPRYSAERIPQELLDNHAELAARISDRNRTRIEAFTEQGICPIKDVDSMTLLSSLRFDVHDSPVIDIIVPCYDEFDKTVECLASIAACAAIVTFRVILVDDCSPDPRYEAFKEVPGLTYVRNPQNLHFLLSCNAAYRITQAPYLLLLNNDTQIIDGALDRLCSAMENDDGLAAATPMILYPNGRLQEAGCAIEADGNTRMVGVGDDPSLPQYQRDRDIAYGSGACLMLRRGSIGDSLFDERFAPAYCEDVDLCVRLRQGGGRIRYVASARCIHHLSASTSAMSERRRLQLIRRNQQKLLEKMGVGVDGWF